jgi:PIN domain nuclease of toxin-antitoxin system
VTRLLVDTHALLWWLADDARLTADARAAIADPANEPLVSVASVWETAIKRSLGKLSAPDDLPAQIADGGFTWLDVRAEHAWHVRALSAHHRDPFDRLLVAQALVEQVPVITADARFDAYGVDVLW